MTPPRLSLGQIDTAPLLARMEALRAEAARVGTHLSAGSIPEETLKALVAGIDRSACLITGDPAFFAAPRAPTGEDAAPARAVRGRRRAGGRITVREAALRWLAGPAPFAPSAGSL